LKIVDVELLSGMHEKFYIANDDINKVVNLLKELDMEEASGEIRK